MKRNRLFLPAGLLIITLLCLIFIFWKRTATDAGNKNTNGAIAVDNLHSQDPDDLTDSLIDGDCAIVSSAESTVALPDRETAHIPSTETTIGETTDHAGSPTKDEFFSDALFIGDSRTVGLQDYAELETATFFAYSGLSSFSAFKKTLDVEGVGETTLEELLTTQHYGKIYLMLGINELGYPFSSIVSQYTHVAEKIHELHPHARIILCANLRVVADGKEKRDYIANDTINQLNAEIETLADGETFYYVDVNPLFDDGNGALDPQYCADDLHPYGKYYYQWAEWLYEVGTETVN